MMIPSVTSVIRLDKIFDELSSVNGVELTRSTLGKPVLKIQSGDNYYFYVLDREPHRVVSLGVSTSELKLRDIVVKSENSELVISAGGRVFRGSGFIRTLGTTVYLIACKRSKCLAGILDVVDGVTRLYEIDSVRLDLREIRNLGISTGFGGFSVGNKSLTLSVSVNGIELIPGFFKFVVSCPTGDYLVDRDGFLVRVRNGVLDVLGKVSNIVSAACVNDGIVLADLEGLKVVKYGAYTTVLKEAIKEVSSFSDVISVVNRAGLIKILNGRSSFVLDSPLLRSCVSTSIGVACLAEDLVAFLDPLVPTEVEVEVYDGGGREGLIELFVKPWLDGCRFSILPRIAALWEQKVVAGVLRALIYPRTLGWEGYVKVKVECPTYYRVVEEYVKFGKLELTDVVSKSLAIAKSGKLLSNVNHNCLGQVTLRIASRVPIPVPIKVEVVGVGDSNVILNNNTINPGLNEVSIKFSGKCLEKNEVLVKLIADSEFFDPEEIATIYLDPREFKHVEKDYEEKIEVFETRSKSVIKAPSHYLKLFCMNGNTFEGYDYLLVENCEEPALLELTRVMKVDDESFELSSSKVFRDSIRKCLHEAYLNRAVSGGFYADCIKYDVAMSEKLHVKIEHEGDYLLVIYLEGKKIFEQKLEPIYLVTGFSVSIGASKVGLDWRDVVWLTLKAGLSVGCHMREVVYGERNI
ncbi:MAG: hypothetical protein QXM78_00420 [Sulfolobales archaeon]